MRSLCYTAHRELGHRPDLGYPSWAMVSPVSTSRPVPGMGDGNGQAEKIRALGGTSSHHQTTRRHQSCLDMTGQRLNKSIQNQWREARGQEHEFKTLLSDQKGISDRQKSAVQYQTAEMFCYMREDNKAQSYQSCWPKAAFCSPAFPWDLSDSPLDCFVQSFMPHFHPSPPQQTTVMKIPCFNASV